MNQALSQDEDDLLCIVKDDCEELNLGNTHYGGGSFKEPK
jgi:hypothetical protein